MKYKRNANSKMYITSKVGTKRNAKIQKCISRDEIQKQYKYKNVYLEMKYKSN